MYFYLTWYNISVRCIQFTSSCVALHLPTRPHGVTANYRHSVISSDLELSASIDDVRLAVNVRHVSESSFPVYDGKAHANGEARRACGDEGTRAAATWSVLRLFMATLATVMVLCGTYTTGDTMILRSIRIQSARTVSMALSHNYSEQVSASCVALHLPTRHNGVMANYRHSVISSDLELSASIDDVRLAVNVRPYGRMSGEDVTCATLQNEQCFQ